MLTQKLENTNSSNDMDLITSKLLNEQQCKPPHWTDAKFPICNDTELIKQYNINNDIPDSNFLNKWIEPCDQVQTASFSIREVSWSEKLSAISDDPNGTSAFGIVFNSHNYREIRHTQDFNLESLIGNIGGYIGLFLGFAFWQIPDALDRLYINLAKLHHISSCK